MQGGIMCEKCGILLGRKIILCLVLVLICLCTGTATVEASRVSLDYIVGSPEPGVIYSETEVSFRLRVENTEDITYNGMNQGFRVYSPDGATWTQTSGDTLGQMGFSIFDLVFAIMGTSIDGIGADSILIGGACIFKPGIPVGYNEVAYEITIGPIPSTDIGKTICIDTSFYPPSGVWLWHAQSGYEYPDWDGPHCVTVGQPLGDTLINLVQWPSAEGGNDHWYGIIPIEQPWDFHTEMISDWELYGEPAYLATILTPMENAFIYDNLIAGNSNQPNGIDEFYLGGYNDSGWVWMTDEVFDYTNWATGEPSGDGWAMAIWGATEPDAGLWNDVPHNGPQYSIHQLWAIVEFGPDEEVYKGDSLLIPDMTVYEKATSDPVYIQPVQSKIGEPIKGATIPLSIPPDVYVKEVSFEGLITENWDFNYTYIKPDSGFVLVVLGNSWGETIPQNTTTVCNLIVESANPDCELPMHVRWDTTLSNDVSRRLTYAGLNNLPKTVGFDSDRDITIVPPRLTGDVNNDGSQDIMDPLYMVDYMFDGGPPPRVINSLDINGDCMGPDISDLLTYIDFLFLMGDEPDCGCLTNAAKVNGSYRTTNGISVELKEINNEQLLILHTDRPVRGIEYVVSSHSDAVKSSLDDRFTLHNGYDQSTHHGVLLDFSGQAILQPGQHQVLKLPKGSQINSVLVADQQNIVYQARLTGPDMNLPDQFVLSQNYPNPFNPSTTISFSLPQATHATLAVYNIAGQKLVTLVDKNLEAGDHNFEWNASEFASGIYVYKLTAGGFTVSKKMLLMK